MFLLRKTFTNLRNSLVLDKYEPSKFNFQAIFIADDS